MPERFDRRRSTVLAFDSQTWEPPAAVVIDTSVAAEALLRNEPEHPACDELFRRLAGAGTRVVFNRLLELELWEVIFNHALRVHTPRAARRHVRFTSAGRQQAARALRQGQRRWDVLLATLDWRCVGLDDVTDAVPDLMRSYGLQSYDAVHAATLLATGVTDLVTRDAGFAVLLPEDATLHTTGVRLARTRARRRRRGGCG